MTTTDQLGRLLAGRYQIERELGRGASAQVWRAFDVRLRRLVAVKILHPGLAQDHGFLRRFRAEAQLVAQLNHPNLLAVYDWGDEADGPFLVGEYLAGGSLRDLYDAGTRLSLSQAAALGSAAAHGLAYAHRRGLVHRDIKPANLLFDEEGRVRIADFGLARALAESASTEPMGTVLGTARYASPEQAEGRPLDGRSDVYSLALVLYEAVTGRVPFSADTTLATLNARIGRRLPPARALGALYPLLVEAALADPLARLDAGEFAAELELLASTLEAPEPLPIVAARERLAASPPGGERRSPRPGARPDRAGAPGELERAAPGNPDDTMYGDTVLDNTVFDNAVFDNAVFDNSVRGDHAIAPGADDTLHAGLEVAARGSRRHGARQKRLLRRGIIAAAALLALGAAAYGAQRLLLVDRSVPDLADASLPTARAATEAAGLHLAVGGRTYSSSVPPGEVVSERPAAGATLAAGGTVRVELSLGRAPVTVPTVSGLGAARARALLRAAHFRVAVASVYSERVAAGQLISATPSSGSAPYGSVVHLVRSLGPHPRTIPAGLVGSSWASASQAISALRLNPVEHETYSSTVAAGSVIATSPAEGSAGIPVGATVSVVVSKGPPLVAIPPVAGDTLAVAVATLRNAGLVVSEVIGPPFANNAVTTNPAPGTSVAVGSSVQLYAS